MQILFSNDTHIDGRSYDCKIVTINGKKCKITYEAYNAAEKCNTEIFDGYKWCPFLSMWDTGSIPNNSAYIWDSKKRKERANMLFKRAVEMCTSII